MPATRLAISPSEASQVSNAPVLRQLSEHFELCAYGLSEVRKEWEASRPPDNPKLLS